MIVGKDILIYNISFSSNIIEKNNYILSSFFDCHEGDEAGSYIWRYNVSLKILDCTTNEFESFFSINRNGSYYENKKENILSRCWIKLNKDICVDDKDKLEPILCKLNEEDAISDGDFFNIKDPIILCVIPFLDDDIKNWIISYGIINLNFNDIKSMIIDSIKIL